MHRRPSDYWNNPRNRLPNLLSPHKTVASFHLDIHYAELKIRQRWTWQRYCRLAAFLRLTPWELGSLCCIPHTVVTNCKRTDRFTGPAALLLTFLEAHFCAAYTIDIIPNPFPNLNEVSTPHARPEGS